METEWPSTIFARRVRLLRRARGLTQEAVAEAAGLSRASLSNIEACRQRVSLDRAEQIAFAIHEPLWRLLCPTEVVTVTVGGVRMTEENADE